MMPETKADLWVIFLEEIQSMKDLAAGLDFQSLDALITALQTMQQEFEDE